MTRFYRIAGLTVCMDVFGRLESQSIPYEIDQGNSSDIDIYLAPNIVEQQVKFPGLSDDSYLYMASGKNFGEKLLDYDGILIHSSAIVKNGKAYLFSANSGTGKSTHTSLWRRVFGDENVRILNDDKPVLRLEDGKWFAYGTPWSGKTGLNANIRVPLDGIAFLERGMINEIIPCNAVEAVPMFLSQGPNPKDAQFRGKLLELIDNLITNIPIWKLKCNMDPEAAIVAYEAMSGNKLEGETK